MRLVGKHLRLDYESVWGNSVLGCEEVVDILSTSLAQVLVTLFCTCIRVSCAQDGYINLGLLAYLLHDVLGNEVEMLHFLVVEHGLADLEIYCCRSHFPEEFLGIESRLSILELGHFF